MDVILREDVEKVGLRGDVVSVARGFARNYLLPRRLAEPATPAKVAELRKREQQRARHEAKSTDEARQISSKLAELELRFDVKAGPTGSLFGSVTATNVADTIWESARIRVDRRKIDLQDPIKRIGRYTIGIEVYEDVPAEVRVIVVPEGGELPPEEELEALAAEEAAAAADEELQRELAHEQAEEAIEEIADEPEPQAGRDEPEARTGPDEPLAADAAPGPSEPEV